jgi:hypothetical protein
MTTSHHHPPPPHHPTSDHHPTTVENERVCSFSSFYITTTFPLPKLSTRAQFRWWLVVPCHHHLPPSKIEHLSCSILMVIDCFTSPLPQHCRNRARMLVFDSVVGCSSLPPSKSSAHAHFRWWLFVFYHHHPTTLETEPTGSCFS